MRPIVLLLFTASLLGACHPFEAVDGDPFPDADTTFDTGSDGTTDVSMDTLPEDCMGIGCDDLTVPDVVMACDCPTNVPAHGVYACNAENVCVLNCDPGHLDCDDRVTTGCEQPDEGCGTCCEGGICCDGACTPKDDPSNCGGCGVVCVTGSCSEKMCQCDTSDPLCQQGGGGVCCQDGTCVADPMACATCLEDCQSQGLECCNGTCIDVTGSDTENCGGCSLRCGEVGPNATSVACNAGVCERRCVSGFYDCDGMPGCETPITDDDCDGCGMACNPGTTCTQQGERSTCACPMDGLLCAGTCVQVTNAFCGSSCQHAVSCGAGSCVAQTCECGGSAGTCNPGETCDDDSCMCGQNPACGAGYFCCPGGCKDVQTDNENCGDCGIGCGAGEICCDGGCVDVFSDPTHCGGCNSGCNTNQNCTNGLCTAPTP